MQNTIVCGQGVAGMGACTGGLLFYVVSENIILYKDFSITYRFKKRCFYNNLCTSSKIPLKVLFVYICTSG